MSKTIRWLHLSDFHVGKDDHATQKMFAYILDHVGKRKEEGFVLDLLFLTGDLANKGLTAEYETFWQDFIFPLQDLIGGGISNRTFAVPGNHDLDRTKYSAFSQEEIAQANSHYFDPTDEGARLRGEMLTPRFKNFVDNDCSPTKDAFAGPDGAFARTISIRGHEIGIVGINTAWLSKDDKDERQLTPGKSLLENALNAIQQAKLRIVLGHHPVDWFRPDQKKPITSLLGQHQVLYLHGHLHDEWVEPTYGGGQSFLAIQSGAGFQAREGEKWRNGLVWGEVDFDAGEVKLQPRHWNADQQDWTLATDAFHNHYKKGDWWHYPLPSNQPIPASYAPATPEVQPPKGWSVAKSEDLNQHCVPLSQEAALRFFDGAVPDWHEALSSSIPRRKIVGRLVNHFKNAETAEAPIIALLLAAGCEGKTTAMLQTAYEVVKGRNDWRILQRRDEALPFVVDDILPVLTNNFHWLLVLDESDRAAPELLNLFKRLPPELHGRVHCLLACRDSDWRASKADQLSWSGAVSFQQEHLTGLDKEDAQAIVAAWQTFGETGLGDLARIPEDQRASTLENQAKVEAKTTTGAFYGALLAVRHSADLHNHARLLLERLGQRKIRSGGTLRDALAYVAAMHAEGLEYLSRPVLAKALGCPIDKLHRDVLVPLGQEAAATTTSSFIFTRHRRIAEALVSVLEKEFAEDIGGLYKQLSMAAINVLNSGQFLPENPSEWRFHISSRFFDQGKHELALNIANAVLSCEPTSNLPTRVHVANLYRKSGKSGAEQAVKLFQEVPEPVQVRGFYYEWGAAEGGCGRHALNVWLAAYSLSDQCLTFLIDNNQAKQSLAGLGVAFGDLYTAYNNPAFRDARMAVAVLGQTLRLDGTAAAYLKKHENETLRDGAIRPTLDIALQQFSHGVAAAISTGVDESVATFIPREMTFNGLQQLVFHSSLSKK
ncbi:MAG: metallophosphoesterase [Gallionella sp.]